MPHVTSTTCTLAPSTRTRTALLTTLPSAVFSAACLGVRAPLTRTHPLPQSCAVMRVDRTRLVSLVMRTSSPAKLMLRKPCSIHRLSTMSRCTYSKRTVAREGDGGALDAPCDSS
jgi:hypothetical protein